MISKWVLILFLAFAVCEFFGNYFERINRYMWRCKSRSHQSSNNSKVANDNESSNNIFNSEIINNRLNSYIEYISCSCGKQCKELIGLKVHQRTCRVIKQISVSFVDNLENGSN